MNRRGFLGVVTSALSLSAVPKAPGGMTQYARIADFLPPTEPFVRGLRQTGVITLELNGKALAEHVIPHLPAVIRRHGLK